MQIFSQTGLENHQKVCPMGVEMSGSNLFDFSRFCWLTSPTWYSVQAHFCLRHFLFLPHALTFLCHSYTAGKEEMSIKTEW